MFSLRLRHLASSVFATALLALASSVAAAQGGTIQGTVTEQGTNTPLQEARVIVVGTSLVASTAADGKYVVRNVPAGSVDIRVIRVGYLEQKKTLTVAQGGSVTADFSMPKSVVQLQEMVTTATGVQRSAEVGNAVSAISVADVAKEAPISTIADVLNARSAGVSITQGTQTGSGQRIRIRGASSLSLSNEPIFVIDGVRMSANNGSTAFGNGGANFSRLGDISPEDIENIEIVKGPSAATLYGTDAANGVVVITTKKGRAGRAQWTGYLEGGILDDRNWYSENYTLAGMSGGRIVANQQGTTCSLVTVSYGTCTGSDGIPRSAGGLGYDSVRVYTPINDPEVTPLGYGNRKAGGVTLSGGTDAVRYFMSASRDDEVGVFKLDDYEEHRFDSLNINIDPWVKRPNTRLLNSFRGNINASPNAKVDAQLNFGYSTIQALTSNESNNTVGIGSQAFGGPGYRSNGLISGMADSLLGYRAGTPGRIWQEKLGQNVNRMVVSSNVNWRPTSWLNTRANVGTDLTDRVDFDLHKNGDGWPLTTTYRDGAAANARANITTISMDLAATANYNPKQFSWLNSKTTVGSQYTNYRSDANSASGTTLPPGAVTASAGATPGSSESTTMQKTWGLFIEETLGLRDRLFLTGAVRTDQNSAFGTNFQRVYYPKVSLSWVLSDEDFYPKDNFLFKHVSSLRLRAANGASGVQPGPNDALQTYSAGAASINGTDTPIEAYNAIGNPNLKPERSVEWEAGFDSKLFSDRYQFEMTYYSKTTHDALFNATIAPSLGSGASSQIVNIASVKNAGLEIVFGGQLVDNKHLGLDFRINSSLNANKVVSLGTIPPQIGTTNWTIAGYPIGGLWEDAIVGWHDDNGDGILTPAHTVGGVTVPSEIDIVSDTIRDADGTLIGVGTFRGYAAPRYMTSFTPGIELLNRKLRIQGLFDWRSGNLHYNNTERIRCTRPDCNGLFNPNASFEEQAMVVAALYSPQRTNDGYFQPGAFVKFRELTASYSLSESLARKFRARSASLVFSARNLHTWTNYRGTDPESDYTVTGGGDAPNEFQTFGPPSLFQFRINLGF